MALTLQAKHTEQQSGLWFIIKFFLYKMSCSCPRMDLTVFLLWKHFEGRRGCGAELGSRREIDVWCLCLSWPGSRCSVWASVPHSSLWSQELWWATLLSSSQITRSANSKKHLPYGSDMIQVILHSSIYQASVCKLKMEGRLKGESRAYTHQTFLVKDGARQACGSLGRCSTPPPN